MLHVYGPSDIIKICILTTFSTCTCSYFIVKIKIRVCKVDSMTDYELHMYM